MGARLFDEHEVRRCHSLDGPWLFAFPETGTTLAGPEVPGARREVLEVPAVWETLSGRENYRGEAWATRSFRTAEAAAARLVFQGVSHTAEVYLDGNYLGAHHNAYTPFAFDVPWLEAGEHRLELKISNAYGELSALHLPNDYYSYGGISRPVELQQLNGPLFLRRIHVVTRRERPGWVASLRVCVARLGDETVRAAVEVTLAGRRWSSGPRVWEEGDTWIEADLAWPEGEVQPWTPEQPHLHRVVARLEGEGFADDLIDRIGFREITVSGREIHLNGRAIQFRGVNRHEDHPDHGCALPVAQMRRDLALIEELGCNAVRTAHYPNDRRFLDLCDERGLLVWEENHARALYEGGDVRSLTPHPMRHPRFEEQAAACNEEMVLNHFNHPSIVLWGILNECDSFTPFGRSHYQRQFAQIRALDGSRPVTYASCHHGDERKPKADICQDLPDVCGWNFYHNWYEQLHPAEGLRRALGRWEEAMAGKPMIVAEFGADALPGYRDPRRRAKWSEERQGEALLECLDTYLEHPRLAGFFLWQFCDVRVDEAFAPRRPRVMNNKGVVDEYRRPKLAFEAVARRIRACAS